MSKISWIIFIIFSIAFNSFAQNPIVPPGVYMADPAAHVWNDGKLYVYGSVDESADYYCLPDHKYTEGVALSASPTGPFTDGRHINLYGHNQIDPGVFTDDDGQAYYVWGQFTMKMASLKPNLTELDAETIQDSVLTESEHFFHEGAFMTKRHGLYYLVYADLSRANTPSCLGYATSEQPTGPYRYRGVIIDNDRCDPANWNNHGSIAEFEGQWYVFYHRATHASQMLRKACVEPITFNPDGSITEVEMTSQGAAPPLEALSQIDAERACLLFGKVRIQRFTAANEELGGIQNHDRVAYKYLDFGNGVDQVTFRVKPGKKSGKIDLALDVPWHPSIGTVDVQGSETAGAWQDLTVAIKSVSGVHALWLRFSGETGELFSIDWFKYFKKEAALTPK